MSGQLVLAELAAFRAVLSKAGRGQGDAIRAWSRSTITNALHRIGPVPALNDAAQHASQASGALAQRLEADDGEDALVQARSDAITALDGLIETIRHLKTQAGQTSSG